ncbi:platelet-activating factor acetylhydrolase precursor [Verticillium alfalfae VaMs.102]|uniref:Putative phospholipase n=1 Tax=Verticillium alfalfae (strain VaMs.102 / ATCC MYA-4576 / FGSC 10136) TaxID=526221 RepID=C9SNW2_VERA1|nr:platelet-activating factor acetylhydrolase precursor [Verticillium alfalfae VaMs.102]EEY20477.1 platelet-activating factor acetylhydrolase precursor [Verticillium alfalfae VaMs.102]
MTSSSSPTAKLSAYLSQLNPVPTFPDYTGPYKVGTVDVEIPVSELESPSPAPDSAADIYTVSCRIYYPATPDSAGKPISWLPSPQRHHVSAYTQFVGIKPLLADFVSFLPRHLHYTTIPALKNADLLEPNTPNGRWPTMIFSHGLGGNRNTYSVVAGSLASHGIVVVCPEHRDGSAVASFVRIPQAQDSYFIRNTRRVVPYIRLPHDNTPEISTAREDQLRIRLWELGLAHAAILAIDRAQSLKNLNKSTPSLDFFAKKLHVHEPGSIIFAGHSFGSASIVQLLKSTYYAGTPALAKMERPLFTPAPDSELSKQITEKNVTMLLDMWCFPLLAPNSAPLFDLPLPAYANVPSAPGGKALLAVESDAFYKWTEHLHVTARVLSPDPSKKVITADLYQRNNGIALPEPNFFYVEKSAHLSQSDFGILLRTGSRSASFNSVEPERALRVNLRAQLKVLRANSVPVGRNWSAISSTEPRLKRMTAECTECDGHCKIVDCWHWVETIGKGDEKKADAQAGEGVSAQVADLEASAPQIEAEIEPPVVGRTVSASA